MCHCVPVQESLAVVYAPSSPRVYTIYEPVIRLKGQAKTVVTQRPFSSKEVQSVSLEPNSLRALLPTETQGLQSVLHKIGGTGNFVFLFAQVRMVHIFNGALVESEKAAILLGCHDICGILWICTIDCT